MKTISHSFAEKIIDEHIYDTANYRYITVESPISDKVKIFRIERWKVGTTHSLGWSEWEQCRTPDDD